MPDEESAHGPSSRPVYGISVAAGLVGMGQQTLRMYERKGLVEPGRTEGGTRLYSDTDLIRLRRIADLISEGLNLAGVGMVLHLEAVNTELHQDLDAARRGKRLSARSRDPHGS